jgi:hypothetical protein
MSEFGDERSVLMCLMCSAVGEVKPVFFRGKEEADLEN